MKRRSRRLALAALALALLGLALESAWRRLGKEDEEPRTAPLALLGPFLGLAAEIQWLRFASASLHGEEARALELAEQALALDPASTEGWQALAAHVVFDLASREREPDLERRRAWFAAGLSVLARGEERAAHGAELAYFRGLVLVAKAEGDPELDPLGARALFTAAVEAFERAAAAGVHGAAELASSARERAAAQTSRPTSRPTSR